MRSPTRLLPHRFLFRYSFPVHYEKKLPRAGKGLLALTTVHRLPALAALDGAPVFGDLRLAWNESGLGVSVDVRGRRKPLNCDPNAPDASDGLQVWIDTRNTQNVHRASRFCHQFCLMPKGAGRDEGQPFAAQIPIARAREPAPAADMGSIRIASEITREGYRLEAWLTAKALHGFDPEAQPRLGFYYSLRDSEFGEQTLSVGAEFPFAFDPSLWGTLELVRQDRPSTPKGNPDHGH